MEDTEGTGNRDWAYAEARRRATVLKRGYAVYQSVRKDSDYIIRPKEDVAPDFERWRQVATIDPGGGVTMYR